MKKLLILLVLMPFMALSQKSTTFKVEEYALVANPKNTDIKYVTTTEIRFIEWTTFGNDMGTMKEVSPMVNITYDITGSQSSGTDEEGFDHIVLNANVKGDPLKIKIRIAGNEYRYPVQVYFIYPDYSYILYNCTVL